MSNPLKTERTKLTEAEADALSTLAHIAVTTTPTLTVHRNHASALLAYMSRLEIERNELRTELTASEKRVQNMAQVLRVTKATLPHMGGNDMSTRALVKDISDVLAAGETS